MLRMGFRLVFNLVTIHYFSWSIINLIDIRTSKRNVFRDFSPFSSLPNLSLYLHVALQDGSFPAPKADWEQGKVVSETTGTVSFPLLSHELSGTGWRLLYLPHTIRSLVYQKCNGSEWPKLKVAGENLKKKKKTFLGFGFPHFTDRYFLFPRNYASLLRDKRWRKTKAENPWTRILGSLHPLRIHQLKLSLLKTDYSSPTV